MKRDFILYLLLMIHCYGFAQSNNIPQTSTASSADSARSGQLSPTQPRGYYVDQGIKYFRTMETGVSNKVRPSYSKQVIRWEWHPWLLLTGYKRANLINTDILLKLYSTKYDTIDCRAFEKEPFCRCHVIFNYSGKRIPIYEEFTFNNQGEITFIEAWSDYPSLLPMKKTDYWAEGDSVKRLSTRIPGLGNAKGLIQKKAEWMKNAARNDSELADMLFRIKRPVISYTREAFKQRKDIAVSNHPPAGDRFPYYP